MERSDLEARLELFPALLKTTAAGVDLVRGFPAGLVILLYHRVGARTSVRVDLETSVFRCQMEELAETKRILSIDDALAMIAAGDDLSDAAVVTFDDGTKDFTDVAAPILHDLEVPATIYVATKFVDEQVDFPDDGEPTSWSELRDVCSSGLITVGSHTHSHLLLDRADASHASQDIDRSVGLIENHLEVAPQHFAYPKALVATGLVEEVVRSRFRSAVVAGTKANPAHADVHRLARSPIQTTDHMVWFRRKVAGGMGFEDRLRQRRNQHRYAGAAT